MKTRSNSVSYIYSAVLGKFNNADFIFSQNSPPKPISFMKMQTFCEPILKLLRTFNHYFCYKAKKTFSQITHTEQPTTKCITISTAVKTSLGQCVF